MLKSNNTLLNKFTKRTSMVRPLVRNITQKKSFVIKSYSKSIINRALFSQITSRYNFSLSDLIDQHFLFLHFVAPVGKKEHFKLQKIIIIKHDLLQNQC